MVKYLTKPCNFLFGRRPFWKSSCRQAAQLHHFATGYYKCPKGPSKQINWFQLLLFRGEQDHYLSLLCHGGFQTKLYNFFSASFLQFTVPNHKPTSNDSSVVFQPSIRILKPQKTAAAELLYPQTKVGDTMDHAWSLSALSSASSYAYAEISLCSSSRPHF